MAVEIDKRKRQVIDISKIFPEYVNMNEMSEPQYDPVMEAKLKKAEKEQGVDTSKTPQPSLITKRKVSDWGVRGLKDPTGEHKKVVTSSNQAKSERQTLNVDLTTLNVLKREGIPGEYDEYREKVAPEVKKIYTEQKQHLTPGYSQQIRSEALKHGIDNLSNKPNEVPANTTAYITTTTEEAKKKVGPLGIARIIEKFRPKFGRYLVAKHEERIKASQSSVPTESDLQVPIKK